MEVVHPASYQYGARAKRSARRRAMLFAALFFLTCTAGLAFLAVFGLGDGSIAGAQGMGQTSEILARARFDRPPGKDAAAIVASTGLGADALEKLSPEAAMAANARIPVATDVGPAPLPLLVPLGDGKGYLRALDCMTAAVYYEAANEPGDGQRAVAQVILNRVHHFSYPKTVCGVVFQGAHRKTGCQFSFTCDGSMLRKPSVAGWLRARAVANAALAGMIYAPVGLATHYHADYVLPYWAPTLVRQAVIGRHIFYRWPGQWGKLASFAGAYANAEPDVFADPKLAGDLLPEGQQGDLAIGLPAVVTPEARPVLPLAGAAPETAAPALAVPPRALLSARGAGSVGTASAAPPAPTSMTGGVIMPDARPPVGGQDKTAR